MRHNARLFQILPAALLIAAVVAVAQSGLRTGENFKEQPTATELQPDNRELIRPDDLAKSLQSSTAKPAIFNVGPRLIYVQAHIPGAEFIGPTSSPQGLETLRTHAASLPRNSLLVIYCGCCPWEHCPNIRPAYKELKQMGFTRLKVLYLPNSFGTDWVEKGYPVQKGE